MTLRTNGPVDPETVNAMWSPMKRTRPRGLAALIPVLALSLLAAACGGSPPTSQGEAPSTTASPVTTAPAAPESSTTTVAPSTTAVTTTVAPTTTAVTTTVAPTTTASTTTAAPTLGPPPLPPCPDLAGPAAGPVGGTITLDANGNGYDDTVSTWFEAASDSWWLLMAWGNGGSTEVMITDSSPVAAARPLGVVDLNGDGQYELFAIVDSGASAQIVGVFELGDCTVNRMTFSDSGAPAAFPVGASIGSLSGVACSSSGSAFSDIDALFATDDGTGMYDGGAQGYTVSGTQLVPGFGDGAVFANFDEAAAAVAGFDCPPISF